MEKGQIRKLNKELSQELLDAQEYFIYEAENHTDFYLQNYIESPSSYRGHYICADLFKEMFQKYTESIDTRKKYAEVVHNSAAVLSNEMFHQIAKKDEIKKCLFLSGVPGAGKSFFIQSLILSQALEEDIMVYEGDISSPSVLEKMQVAKENNLDMYIIIVNPTIELAQQNAIARHYEIGRGASCETMARIMSRIPGALENIHKLFPEIELGIYNKTTNYAIDYLTGFENMNLLNHGDYEEILKKLYYYREKILLEINQDLKKKSEGLENSEVDRCEKR